MNIKYINIPSNLLFDNRISDFAKLLYGELCVLCYKNGVCMVSNAFLAQANNCSTRTVIRALKLLKEYEYIKIEEKYARKIYINMTKKSFN